MPKFYNIKGNRISSRTYTNDPDISLERHERQVVLNYNIQNIIATTFHKKKTIIDDNKDKENIKICVIS